MQKIAAVSLLVVAAMAETYPGCYKQTTTRGVGHAVDACPAGTERDGLLCYPPCQSGFDAVGPVCWEKCPAGTIDTGAFCQADIVQGDNAKCQWYDKCGLAMDKGCVKCPAGFNVDGCLCKRGSSFAKKSYSRGAGKALVCPLDRVYDAGLCYPACPAGQAGEGPVCWGSCPPARSYACGAMCLQNSTVCSNEVKSVAKTLFNLIEDSVLCKLHVAGKCTAITFMEQIRTLMNDFIMPVCNV